MIKKYALKNIILEQRHALELSILSLWEKGFGNTPKLGLAEMGLSTSIVYVYREKNSVTPVSMLIATDLPLNLGGFVQLSDVTTHPEKRKKGYATRLIWEVKKDFSGRQLKLRADPGTDGFYLKLGFEYAKIQSDDNGKVMIMATN